MLELEQALYFEDNAQWREWLRQNHSKADGVWLVIRKKKNGADGITYTEALEEAICFGWIDGKMKSIDGEKFILRFTPRKKNSLWSKLNKEKAEGLIKSGRMTAAGMAKVGKPRKRFVA
jgi:uncharacterized protein YdeI (YjbR/CyaY-like superfamily)